MGYSTIRSIYGELAQLVEHLRCKQAVNSSNLLFSIDNVYQSIIKPVKFIVFSMNFKPRGA